MAKSDQPGGPPPGGPPPGPEGAEGKRVVLTPYLAIFRRILRSLRGFFAAHVIVLRSEAHRELARLLVGASLMAGALMFLLASAILFATGLVVGVQRFTGLPWLESLGISLGCTLLVALLLGALGLHRLKKPLMPQSRELLKKTLDALSQR
ncbi:MAG: hypothetical protein GXP62_03695 [Oligoflexia bacterium]|nr:hypothetical protein [Oligoflexia bacterium]